MKKLGIAVLVVLTGCVTINDDGGGDGGSDDSTGKSGVVSKRKVTDFTPTEKTTFCEWVSAESTKAAGEYECEGGVEIEITSFSAAQCESELAKSPGCEASKLEACFEVLFGNPCDFENPACANLSACAQDAGNNGDANNGDANNGGANNGSTDEFCYEHTFNGDTTGKQCFSTKTAYCTSLCNESNPLSVSACEAECE